MRSPCPVLAVVLAALLAAPAAAKKPLVMALRWTPTSELSDFEGLQVAQLGAIRFRLERLADERGQRDLVGENREEDDETLPVTTRDDVAAWTTAAVRDVLDRAGLHLVDSEPQVVLSGAVRRLFVTERSTYEGNVALWLTARTPTGEPLWEGLANGAATRWGRSYKAENYNEVFSDSVLDAVVKLLQDPAFATAVKR